MTSLSMQNTVGTGGMDEIRAERGKPAPEGVSTYCKGSWLTGFPQIQRPRRSYPHATAHFMGAPEAPWANGLLQESEVQVE